MATEPCSHCSAPANAHASGCSVGPPGAQTISTLTTSGAPQSTQRLHGACQQNLGHFLWHSFDHKRSVDEPLHMLRCHAPNSQLFQPPQASSYMATEPCSHCSAPANAQTTKQKVTCSDVCGFWHSRLKLRLKLISLGNRTGCIEKRKVCFWL